MAPHATWGRLRLVEFSTWKRAVFRPEECNFPPRRGEFCDPKREFSNPAHFSACPPQFAFHLLTGAVFFQRIHCCLHIDQSQVPLLHRPLDGPHAVLPSDAMTETFSRCISVEESLGGSMQSDVDALAAVNTPSPVKATKPRRPRNRHRSGKLAVTQVPGCLTPVPCGQCGNVVWVGDGRSELVSFQLYGGDWVGCVDCTDREYGDQPDKGMPSTAGIYVQGRTPTFPKPPTTSANGEEQFVKNGAIPMTLIQTSCASHKLDCIFAHDEWATGFCPPLFIFKMLRIKRKIQKAPETRKHICFPTFPTPSGKPANRIRLYAPPPPPKSPEDAACGGGLPISQGGMQAEGAAGKAQETARRAESGKVRRTRHHWRPGPAVRKPQNVQRAGSDAGKSFAKQRPHIDNPLHRTDGRRRMPGPQQEGRRGAEAALVCSTPLSLTKH